jgi:AAA15 family ATPase/GTPase
MNLKEFKFCRFKGETNEWSIEGKPQNNYFEQWFTLGNINLVVGKNATGKSRTIDAIRYIADLVANDIKLSQLKLLGYSSAEYHLKFNDKEEKIEYHLTFENGKITHETLSVDGNEKLNRVEGTIWHEGAKQKFEFQIDDDVLAVSKRDKKQHSFLEKLYFWGKNLNHYRFGTQLGKNAFLRDINVIKDDTEVDLKDGDEVTEAFIKGKRQFPDSFVDTIIKDMKFISYDIEKIDATPLKNFPISGYGLNVKEADLDDITDQREMSQGMFRAFSLLTQLNFALLSKTPSCILIDDIGEGLDYDRSKSLIDLIIQKVEGSSVQVIMTTNDRFVMNKVPLEYWSVIQRIPKKTLFYNYTNSKETFDEFKYTGMSNFDFLTSEFYLEDSKG